MRNLTFVAHPSMEAPTRAFRAAFMQKTATWNVAVEVCDSRSWASSILNGNGSGGSAHAYAATPQFRHEVIECGLVKGASARLSQGADIVFGGADHSIALSQLAYSSVKALEESVMPIYGASVTVLGTGSLAFDFAYECARAGVAEVVLLGADKHVLRENLDVFLTAFCKEKSQIVDTDQTRLGHKTALRAYEETAFKFGAFSLDHSSLVNADIVINASTGLPALMGNGAVPFRKAQMVYDPLFMEEGSSLCASARNACADVFDARTSFTQWGIEAAATLVEFSRATW